MADADNQRTPSGNLLAADTARRAAIAAADSMRAEQKTASRSVGAASPEERPALLARANGVVVMSASQFQVERTGDPRGVRVVLMSPTSREELRIALTQLASLLESGDPKRFY